MVAEVRGAEAGAPRPRPRPRPRPADVPRLAAGGGGERGVDGAEEHVRVEALPDGGCNVTAL